MALTSAPRKITAFIDESGQRTFSRKSSDYFVMSAVILQESDLPASAKLLARIRAEIERGPTDPLHWTNIKNHGQRVHVASLLGSAEFLQISSVVVCKRCKIEPAGWEPGWEDHDRFYLLTLRVLLERLSWIARDSGAIASYMLAHVKRFKLQKLRAYEAELRACKTEIAWGHLDPKGAQLDQPQRLEQLQLADIAASATASAFEPDRYGVTETRYLRGFSGRLYRHGVKENSLTSYGLKMYPWNEESRAYHPWILDL